MVFDVTGSQYLRLFALEFVKQHRWCLAQRIDQYVEAATVSHADDDLVHPTGAGDTNQFIHGHDRGFPTFEREAFLPDITGVQVAFERFGGSQTFEHPPSLLGGIVRLRMDALEAILNPALLGHRTDVHVLDADRSAIGRLECVVDLAKGGVVRCSLERAGIEHRIQVRIGKTVVGGIELRHLWTLRALQGVQVGPAITNETIRGDHLENADLFPVVYRCDCSGAIAPFSRQFGKGIDHRQMRYIAGNVTRQLRQLVEILAPLLGDRAGIVEIVFVQLLDKGCIAAKE
ncbi:MAG: hypothetical protein AW09_001027 [Candidatus Accumulibacter phosphatis]|uniref:Uncharacterized protein n=1 Tax=Candidatus Accumulibacter phosphatis TaxID=327160 RepID=A0A080M048_9PROT|nr:MAG: hypothetical protein AW09_001027 [Candidatus Accumulibacter phosphatis]